MVKPKSSKAPYIADELLLDALARVPELRGILTKMGSVYSLFVQSDLDLKADRRVTLADTARAAGNDPRALIDYLNGVGPRPIETDDVPTVSEADVSGGSNRPELDVRDIIHSGKDPLGHILEFLETFSGAGARQGFVLIVPFDPLPLRRLLAGRGWQGRADQISQNEWHVVFHHDGAAEDLSDLPTPIGAVRTSDVPDGATLLDLRGLEPPQPMIEIIKFLESQPSGASVIAHLDREPVFFYPELTERDWSFARVGNDDDTGFQLRVTTPKSGGGPV